MTALREKYNHFIDGSWHAARLAGYFEGIDPSTGQPLAEFARGARDVDDAVESSVRGFRAWRDMSPAERGRVLHRVSIILKDRVQELAHLESLDSGKPLSVAKREYKPALAISNTSLGQPTRSWRSHSSR